MLGNAEDEIVVWINISSSFTAHRNLFAASLDEADDEGRDALNSVLRVRNFISSNFLVCSSQA